MVAKKYKGIELSPNGLGYYAHAEKTGTKKRVKIKKYGSLRNPQMEQNDG